MRPILGSQYVKNKEALCALEAARGHDVGRREAVEPSNCA